jgi:hypothetical protein
MSRREEALAAASSDRRQDVDNRIKTAMLTLDRTGQAITVAAVAREAGVARQSVYSRPDVMSEIQRLRQHPLPETSRARQAERSSEASMAARNTVLLDENRRLRRELGSARDQIAVLMGDLRTARLNSPSSRR